MSDSSREHSSTLDVKFNDQGLVPAIRAGCPIGAVLMMGWMNHAALEQTLQTAQGDVLLALAESDVGQGRIVGHVQEVLEVRIDCDQTWCCSSAKSHGPCCHVGYQSCFYRTVDAAAI